MIDLVLALALALLGGAFGAAVGALPAFVLTGALVVAGETVPGIGAGFTGAVAFGPVFGPHVSFAGGAAAAAYVGRREDPPLDGPAHPAKDITTPLGRRPRALAVGAAFGAVGLLVARAATAAALPLDPIALGVVGSAFAHRLALGYPILGAAPAGRLDMTPHWNRAVADGGEPSVRPWLPHQSRWRDAGALGVAGGLAAGALALATGSAFLAFGLAALLLWALVAGVERTPAAHHVALPASTGALALSGPATGLALPLLAAAGFGVAGALAGELAQRVAFAHADTHLDPPAASIVATTAAIGALAALGVLPSAVWIGG